MSHKYEFSYDIDKNCVIFGEWELPACSYIKNLFRVYDLARSQMEFRFGNRGDVHKYKAQSFYEQYGISPTKFKLIYNGILYKNLYDPIQKWALQYCYSSGGRINFTKCYNLMMIKDDIEQMEKDGQDNIVPFRVYMGLLPSEMKNKFGKKLWKRLCANSRTKNKYIAKNFASMTTGVLEVNAKALMNQLNSLPSTILKRESLGNRRQYEVQLILLKHYKVKDLTRVRNNVYQQMYIINDTIRMLYRKGEKYNENWSLRKWKERHDDLTKEMLAEKYSTSPFPHLSEMDDQLKEITRNGLTARLLTSPNEIAMEGRQMRHCVASYVDRVEAGDYLIYSTGETTLGLLFSGRWKVQQHFGFANSRTVVTEEYSDLASEIVSKLNNQQKGVMNHENYQSVNDEPY